jgi:hypothetical protein
MKTVLRCPYLLMSGVAMLCLASLALLHWQAPAASAADWPNSLKLKATYDVEADLNWAEGRLNVTSVARVVNTTDGNVRELTFNLLPGVVGQLEITDVSVDSNPATRKRTNQNLSVTLPSPLGAGEHVNVRVTYRAWFASGVSGAKWLFTRNSGIATAYRWIPWLSQPNPFRAVGDAWVTRHSNEVNVRITTDQPLKIASSGRLVSHSGQTYVFRATDVNDFNFSASPDYRTKTVFAGDVEIVVYARTLSRANLAFWAKKAVNRFRNRVGPFPHGRLSVAETPGGTAMESPAHVWISNRSSGATLAYRTVHEVAHQWFYSGVANNQVHQPFADEAVAEFLSRDLLGFQSPRCAQRRLDGSIYDYGASCYYDTIYTQGSRYLNAYGDQHGFDDLWAGLRNYYGSNRYGTGDTRELLDALDRASGFQGGHAERFPSLY